MILPLPIVERELRGAARRRATFGLRTGLAFAFTLVWAIMMASRPRAYTPQQWNYQVFVFLSIVGMLFCLFSGLFLTCDCLSSEKREGTLGLLFLTDLNGRDVVLGKLAAFSVNAIFGLLAVLPLLSLTLMSGGITTAEVYRVVLICFVLLFYSLGIGLGVSARVWGARRAVLASLGIVCAQAILLPIVWVLFAIVVQDAEHTVGIMVFCPVFPFVFAFNEPYSELFGPVYYWAGASLMLAIGLAGIWTACRVLPAQRLQEAPVAKPLTNATFWQDYFHGGRRWREKIRRRFLEADPFCWLGLRDRVLIFWLRAGLVLGLALWSYLLLGAGFSEGERGTYEMLWLAATWLLHIFVKILLGVEASRLLSDSRACGAWELLLVTPLRPAAIIQGAWRALWRVFAPSFTVLLVLNGFILFLLPHLTSFWSRQNHAFLLSASLGGMALLWLDAWALTWKGLAEAIRSQSHLRAMVGALGWVMVPSWAAILLMFMKMTSMGWYNSRPSRLALWAAWFVPTILSSLVIGFRARARVRRDFLAGGR